MIQTKPALLLAATLFLLPAAGRTCSCGWGGPFVKVAKNADLIVRGKILGYHGQVSHSGGKSIPLAMDVEVVETLQGGAATGRRTIRVWGDNGKECRPYVTQFPPGTTWILALGRGKQDPGRVPAGDYSISVCGEYWLKSVGDRVVGKVTANDPRAADQSVPLSRLRTLLKEKP